MQLNFRMHTRHALCALSITAAVGCAGEGVEPDAPAVSEQGSRLLAEFRVSDTHRVVFYELGPADGRVTEEYDLDKQEQSALRGFEIRDGELLAAYRHVAGERAETGALVRLEAYERRRLSFMAQVGPMPETQAEPPAMSPDLELADDGAVPKGIDEERDREAHWFAGKYCDSEDQPSGCLGSDGERFDWMPKDLPVCRIPVEMCGTGFASPFRESRRSKNLRWAAYNQSNSDELLEAVEYLNDPCENDSWWQNLTTVCKDGGQLAKVTIKPHTAHESTSTSGATWTRTLELTGGHPIGVKLNTY